MAKNKRVNASKETPFESQHMPEFIYDDRISHQLKIELEKALAHYAVQHSLAFGSQRWKEI